MNKLSKHVIVFNGPPHCGKDTAANMIESKYQADHLRFKTKLYEITALINNVDLEEFLIIATDEHKKDTVIVKNGRTARQLLIQTSEEVIKPNYGKDYFGVVVGDSILQSHNHMFVISDSGFEEELIAMIRGGELDSSNVLVVRLYRDGCDFSNDSRNYLSDDFLEENEIRYEDIKNDSDEAQLLINIEKIMYNHK